MSLSLYKKAQALQNAGTPVAVATIVLVKGSVPREVGAKMLVHPMGLHEGTVGGGCGEADVIRAGLETIRDGQNRMVRVDLTEDISMDSLGVCGGIMNVFVEPLPAVDTE